MENNLLQYLLTLHKEKLPDNDILKLFLTTWNELKNNFINVNNIDKKALYEQIERIYSKNKSLEVQEEIFYSKQELAGDIKSNTDYRCQHILLSNVRGIGDKKDNVHYGINFVKDKEISNAVIIGSNASGKSSVFDALEYIYCGKIGEKEYRNFPENEIKFLENEISKRKSFIEISTISEDFTLEDRISNRISNANPSVSFISEYDILENIQKNINDSNYTIEIAQKLGFNDFTNFKLNLNEVNNYRRQTENRDLNNINNKITNNKLHISSLTKEIEELVLSKEINAEDIKNKQANDLIQKKGEIEELLSKDVSIPDVKFLNEICNKFHIEYEKISQIKSVSQATSFEKIDFLQRGLMFLEQDKECPFCGKSEKKYEDIKIDVNNTISSFREYSRTNEALKQHFESTVIQLNDFITRIHIISEILDTEIYFPPNDDIKSEYKVNNNAIVSMLNTLDYEEVIEKINSFPGKGYLDKEKEMLHSIIIEKGASLLNIEFWNSIDQKLKKRSSIINEIRNHLKLELEKITAENERLNIPYIKKQKEKEKDQLIIENKSLEEERKSIEDNVKTYNKIKSEINILFREISNYIDSLVLQKIEPYKEIIENTMNPFLKKDNMKVEISFPEITDKIGKTTRQLNIKLKLDNQEIDPKKFFNNARYKMFSTALAIAIALASRKTTGINLPIAMDDEFFDCDIINRAEFETFFSTVIFQYYKTTPELPFQFIIFTHDELVFSSTRKAIITAENLIDEDLKKNEQHNVHEYWKDSILQRTYFARLFPFNEIDNKESVIKDKNFWNLLYVF